MTEKSDDIPRRIENAVAWALNEDEELGLITGDNSDLTANQLELFFRYQPWQVQTILFIREIERAIR